MAMRLDQIIPWGRTFREYELMFQLGPEELAAGVLDCGGGPASFNTELTARGHRAVSIDPIYAFTGADIRARFEAAAPGVMAQVAATPDDWDWSYHRDPAGLFANRTAALERFLADYECGLAERRYRSGELPVLDFRDDEFGLALSSHLLFLYSELLPAEIHIRSVRELCRVAREVRIFPLVDINGRLSPHVGVVREAVKASGWQSEIVKVDYGMQRGGIVMLRIFCG